MRCDNEYCLRNSKENKAKPKSERVKASVRSKIVFDFIYDFLETKLKLTKKVKYGSAIEKDKVCRIIFLNFTVGDQKVTNYRLKEPFATLLKDRVFLSGRGCRI